MSAAELALSARVRGLTQEHVGRALWEERTLVKTWTLRGTLHLHAADELGLWLAARRAVVADWYFANEVRPKEAKQILAALAGALDGRCLTRDELVEAVTPHVSGWAREHIGSGWGTVLGPAALNGVLVHGPPQGTRVTFVRPDQWFGEQQEWEPQAALVEILRRYLRAFGPATHNHFAAWVAGSHLKAKDAKALLDSIAGELVEVEIEGKRAWLLADDRSRSTPAGGVRLIPEYDAYVMGFREREHLVPPEVRAQVATHGKGRYEGPAGTPFLVVDGLAAGIWRRKKTAKRIELTVEPARTLTRAERAAVADEAERIGLFLGLEPRLTVER